ncbi:hypothetical protein COLO4_05079 [Corchorus olitorius]|uniref:Uncharacterized protein n=1 Tax=Corchorus olitorius TaxID=93759 RepID=A0A1R3KS10_9ROSI|nr:hypothetical protein COLO4_05079 [Corchorus olitorius]
MNYLPPHRTGCLQHKRCCFIIDTATFGDFDRGTEATCTS